MARTSPRPLPATTVCGSEWTASSSASPPAWLRPRILPSTRPAGRHRTRRTTAALRPTRLLRLTVPWLTGSTYSTTRCPAASSRTTRWSAPSSARPPPGFVATSAGNRGGTPGSVTHVAPWVTTVAASSSHQVFQGALRLRNGSSYVGAMVSDHAVRSTGLVLGADVAAPGVAPGAAARCETGSLEAAKADGKIVICDRGGGARVDKSAAVADAGGAGMVLANTRRQSTDADVHAVPTVHLDLARAAAVKTYVRRAGNHATASLDPNGRDAVRVPAIADFSGRGPARAAGGDVLKPDLTAPGVSVLGAVAPPSDS